MHRPVVLLALALSACAPGSKGDGGDGRDDSASADGAVTWYRDIQPLVERSCATCHGASGLGGANLTDYATAAQYAPAMAGYTSMGLMPPPAMDPDCQPYAGDDRMSLSDEEVALIQAWSDAGAPQGDPASAPAPVEWGTHIEDPDLVLEMPFTYTLHTDRDGNEYFCTVVDNPLDERVYITGLDVKPGNPQVVHHMILAIDEGGDAGKTYGDTDTSDGFDCRNPIMESDWKAIHAWAPGMDATWFPDGLGMALDPGDQIVIQMHYYAPDGGTHTDQSSYLLRVTDRVDKTIGLEPIGPTGFRIPAGDPSYSYSESIKNEWLKITAYGVFPHLHLLGTGYEGGIKKANGEEVCFARGNYDFSHQAFYIYDEPLTFEIGDTVWGGCTWDNSADNPSQFNDPPEDIGWGEGSNQEMCYFLTYYSL